MTKITSVSLATLFLACPCFGYGPPGHETVGAIADELLAKKPAGAEVKALIDGITLQRAAVMPDEIKGWDKKGVDDPKSFHYRDHPKIDMQLREFWRANPPTHDVNSPMPSHHWFHYTDVPVVRVEKYADGKVGRSKWDIVQMIPFCVDVLQGRVPENNERKITKAVAVILLAHFVGDIHQPLHVGAQYFNDQGRAVDPDKEKALEDEGGNTIILQLNEPPRAGGMKKKKFHGFWDMDTVAELLPQISNSVPKEQRRALSDAGVTKLAHEMAAHEPKEWQLPATVNVRDYAQAWADEIQPIAREAHERLNFKNVKPLQEEDRVVAAGEAEEKPAPDHVGYREWSSKIVRMELQKAGWRLADLLEKSVRSTSTPGATPAPSAAPVTAPPSSPQPKVDETPPIQAPATPASPYGSFPANYKEIITAFMKTKGIEGSNIDWQTEPKPADLPGATGRGHDYGYLVVFNARTSKSAKPQTFGMLIRDGQVINASAFGK
jgi:hypothetical protein